MSYIKEDIPEISQQTSANDSDTSDEDIQLPVDKMYIKKAYKKVKSDLNTIKMKKKMLLGQEQFKKEEMRLLKLLLQKSNTLKSQCKISTTVSIAPNEQPAKSIEHTIYTLQDLNNNCLIKIKIESNRLNKHYLTIKRIIKEMRVWYNEFYGIIPRPLFEYILRLHVEERLVKLLEGLTEKMKFSVLLFMYRDAFPKDGDQALVEKMMSDIWCGDYNDAGNEDGCQSLQSKSLNKAISLDDIPNAKGVWEIICTKGKNKMEVDEETLDKEAGIWSDVIQLMQVKYENQLKPREKVEYDMEDLGSWEIL